MVRESQTVVVLSGDHPLISSEILSELVAAHRDAGRAATVMTTELEDPAPTAGSSEGGGRRDRADRRGEGGGRRHPEELQIKEVNAGTYAFGGGAARRRPRPIDNDNAQGEYYLGDVLPLIREAGLGVAAYRAPIPASTSA